MDDDILRLMRQNEEIRRLVDPLRGLGGLNPLRDALRDGGLGQDVAAFYKAENERRRLLSGMPDLSGVARMAQDLEEQRRLFAGPIEEARRLGMLDPSSDIRRATDEALAVRREHAELFRLPVYHELEVLAREAAKATGLAMTVFDHVDPLRTAMAAMKSPWLQIEHDAASAAAFADLVAMGRGIAGGRAFEAEFGVALRDVLGDWRDHVDYPPEVLVDPLQRLELYSDRGFDSDLTDFTPAAFDEGVRIAGLGDGEEEAVDGETDRDEAGFQRSRQAFDRLSRMEVAIRRFIARAMEDEFGGDWMRRQLPNGMLDGWISKRDRAVEAGQPECPLIEYADFTEYRSIIERRDNWRQVFQPVFRRVEDVRESFHRLSPVRIATMHSRLITLDDDMLLLVETNRIMKAIGAR